MMNNTEVISKMKKIALFMAAAILLIRLRRPVWMAYLFVFASFMLLFWAVVNPVRSTDRSKEQFASGVRSALEKDAVPEGSAATDMPAMTIYKDPAIMGLYSEGCYIGLPVRTLAHDKIPADVDPAYVLTADVPSHNSRTWTRLYDCEYRHEHLYIYKGVSLKKELSDDDEYDYE